MPESSPDRPLCSNCGGFDAVAITTGRRLPDTSRETTVVHCPAHASQKARALDRVGAR